MWTFLNANAGGIQAIAALVTAVVTMVLALTTWQYVRLTQRLAEAASAEMTFREEAEAEKWRELHAYTKLVRGMLAALPAASSRSEADDHAMRQAASWETGDVMRLQRLAARLDRRAGERAAVVVNSMTWLGERLREVKGAGPAEAYDWSKFPWSRWRQEMDAARTGLDTISATVARRLRRMPQAKAVPEGGVDDHFVP
jgi:hypothetical protein